MSHSRQDTQDILIVGAGIFGASSAVELARRGHTVTLFDPGPLPHPRASSTDISKMVRADYGNDRFYTQLALESIAGWHRWNVESGQNLYHETGFLIMTTEQMNAGGFEYDSSQMMRSLGQPVERMTRAELQSRFPAWDPNKYPDGYFNANAGWVESTNVVRWLLDRANDAGVSLRQGELMHSLIGNGARIEGIRTDAGNEFRADVVIVAAGAWTPSLLPWMKDAVRCLGQPVYYFSPDNPDEYVAERFPPWAADIGNTGWYGFPVQADGTLKVANHGNGIPADPSIDTVVPIETDAMFVNFLRSAFPDLARAPIKSRRLCFYCDSWDGDFWIDWDPDRKGLLVATGGSGHAFKFAPSIGKLVADKVDGKANEWQHRFRWRKVGKRHAEAARKT